MNVACLRGRLLVCQWLFKVGASADVTNSDRGGCTPMWLACWEGHLPVCKWLFSGRGCGHHQGKPLR